MTSAEPDYLPDHERVLPRLDRRQTAAVILAVLTLVLTAGLGVVGMTATAGLSFQLQTVVYVAGIAGLVTSAGAIYAPFLRRSWQRWAPPLLRAAAVTAVADGGLALFVLARVSTADGVRWGMASSFAVLGAGVLLAACGAALGVLAPLLERRR